jgi:hypothetical protein
MRKLIAAGAIAGLLFGAVSAPVGAAVFGPRQFTSQQTHYVRMTVTPAKCSPVGLTCSYRVGAVPYNSYILLGSAQVLTTAAGNGVTAFTASIGTASGGAQIVANQAILTAGNAAPLTLVNGGGETATGNGATQTGANGGFDLWVTLTATTGFPTTGLAVLILEYIAPNDGDCVAVPLGGGAAGC